jgi:hypothetical protein
LFATLTDAGEKLTAHRHRVRMFACVVERHAIVNLFCPSNLSVYTACSTAQNDYSRTAHQDSALCCYDDDDDDDKTVQFASVIAIIIINKNKNQSIDRSINQ